MTLARETWKVYRTPVAAAGLVLLIARRLLMTIPSCSCSADPKLMSMRCCKEVAPVYYTLVLFASLTVACLAVKLFSRLLVHPDTQTRRI